MTLSGDVTKLISKHTMLLNRITCDDAVLAAKKWMDAGIFRVNVAAESTISFTELKYLPVWTMPVIVNGGYTGVVSGGIHSAGAQMSDSFKEKDTKGFLSGLGKMAGQVALNALANQGKNTILDRRLIPPAGSSTIYIMNSFSRADPQRWISRNTPFL